VQLEEQDALVARGECTFKPHLNLDPKLLKNRDPSLLYTAKKVFKTTAQEEDEKIEEEKKKRERRAAAAKKLEAAKAKKREKKASEKEKENAEETRMAQKSVSSDKDMRAKFEELLM